MKPGTKKHQPRWRISEETALELSRVRRDHGRKSWEEFFTEMIRRWHIEAPGTTAMDSESDRLLFAIQALETRNDELTDYLSRLTDLLTIALDVKERPSAEKPPSRSAFSRFIQERTQTSHAS